MKKSELKKLKALSKEAYSVFGDDEFFDGIDGAISRAERLMKMEVS